MKTSNHNWPAGFVAKALLKAPVTALTLIVVGALSSCGAETNIGQQPDLAAFFDTPIGDCTAYTRSANFRDRTWTVRVSPQSNWINSIESASAGTEILLDDGEYFLNQYAVQVSDGVTVRSASGNASDVLILGMGYGEPSEGFMILGSDVTIADISIANIRDHAISVQPQSGAMHSLQMYNLDIRDIGTQHIKVNPGGVRQGLIACSRIGFSPGAAVGDYNGAIDLHGTIDWVIRDNYIYNITGDGSGCLVDQDCGQYISAPAIYAWNGAQGTQIIGNTIVDSFRNIALGLGTSHSGGLVSHNDIRQSSPGDAGIELFGATDVTVEFNTVQLAGRYLGTIEFRESSELTITNNWLSRMPWDRGDNVNVVLSGNTFQIP